MTIALNGLGWQAAVHQQQRNSGVDPAAGDMLQFRLPVVASNATAQQGSENTSQQDAEDAREEAFAKLKLQLQNPGTSIGPSADASTEVTSSARQACSRSEAQANCNSASSTAATTWLPLAPGSRHAAMVMPKGTAQSIGATSSPLSR